MCSGDRSNRDPVDSAWHSYGHVNSWLDQISAGIKYQGWPYSKWAGVIERLQRAASVLWNRAWEI